MYTDRAVQKSSLPRIDGVRLALLGACATSFQVLFAREFLAAFSGNEVVLASLMGAWLALTAAGAWLGRERAARRLEPNRPAEGRATSGPLVRGLEPNRPAEGRATSGPLVRGLELLLVSFGPLCAASLFAARALPRLFPAGAAPGPTAALGFAFVLLAPCLASGLCFSWLARGAPDSGGRAYALESVGAAVAGSLLGAFALGRVPSFWLAGAICLGSSLMGSLGLTRARALACAAPGLALCALFFALPIGRWALELQGAQMASAVEHDSALASIVVAGEAGGLAIYVDRTPIVSGEDPALAEESAHLPLALHEGPSAVAVLGVPPPGMLREAARHGLSRIDCVLEDATLAALLREHLPEYREAGLRLIVAEPRRFLREASGQYDAILLFEPEPTTASLNRLYTVEFFSVAAAALRPGGLLAVALPGHAAFASGEKRRLHSSVARTLGAVLPQIRWLPGALTYDIASREPLPQGPAIADRIAANLDARGIAARSLSRPALAQLLSPGRIADAERWASLAEPVNRDLAPTTYHLALERVLADYQGVGGWALAALAAALTLGAVLALGPRSRPLELAIFTSGASSLGLQLTLMVVYQLTAGALYRELGLLLASFMAGAALGARAAARWVPAHGVLLAELAQVVLAVAMAAVLPTVAASGSSARPFLLAAGLFVGLVPGAQFTWASRGRNAGSLYAADLAGAALASLVTLTALVPALGLVGTLVLLGAIKALSAWGVAGARPQASSPSQTGRLAVAVPLAFVLFTLAAASEPGQIPLYAFTMGRAYPLLAVALLLSALAASFETVALRAWRARLQKRLAPVRERIGLGAGWLAHFAVLLPAGAFPVARCYFAVPFLFCHVCPRPCIFGIVRPYAVPAAVIANLFDHHFCQKVCPLGACQAACERLRRPRARRIAALSIVRWGALAFVVLAYFLGERDHGSGIEGHGFWAAFFRNAYAPSTAVLACAAALLVGALFIRRPFCEGLCPIGAVADLADRLGRRGAPEGSGDS
jgi:spermidine synthase